MAMTFEELLQEVKKVKCQEMRTQKANYFEIVVAKANLAPLAFVLHSYFGKPLKPEGDQPSKEASQCAKPYGGIRSNQTLYYRKNEKGAELALLWPWGSGTAVTVKIIQE